MGRFRNFFKNRFRKKKPVELEEPEYLKTLRENLIRGRGFENPQIPVEASSSSDFDDFDSVVPFGPAPEPAELPQSKIPSVSVEEQALEEDSSVDEIYAHHIRARIFRQRITSPMGKVLTIVFVGQLKDGSLAWIGNDDLSFDHSLRHPLRAFQIFVYLGPVFNRKPKNFGWQTSIC